MPLYRGTRVTLLGSKGMLPYEDSFNRGDGAINDIWTGATFTVSGNEAINTPTEGADVATNGNMEAGDPPNNWTAANAVLDGVADERTGGAGIQSLDMVATANGGGATQVIVTTAGTWYRYDAWLKKTVGAGYLAFGIAGVITLFTTGGAAWSSHAGTYRSPGAGQTISPFLQTNGDEGRADDISVKPLTLSTLFASLESGTADVVAQVELDAVAADTQAGLVLNLDDAAAPANFVIGYYDRTNNHAKLDKCVAGTYTSMIDAAAAYAAGAVIRVVKVGTAYSLYYNGAQIGATQTIGDAGIISNTRHGMFSTYAGSTMDDFRLEAS